MRRACLILLAWLACCGFWHGTPYLQLGDFQFFTKGSYGAFMAPFNGAGLTFAEMMTIFPGSFPGNTTIIWSWPSGSPSCPSPSGGGICGFLNLEYGDYNGTVEQTPIVPQQIKNITTLNFSLNIELSGLSSGYDVIYDQFLTSGAGSATTHVAEVSTFLHTPSYSQTFINGATQIGTPTISGITWQVAVSPGAVPDYLFAPSNYADVPNATIDQKAMFAYLVAQGDLTGNEFFNGVAVGVETRQGAGTAVFRSFSVAFT